MPDPGVFETQSESQCSELLYVQALKTHNEAHHIRETISGLQSQLGEARDQLIRASNERIEQNKLLREAMGGLHDASDRRPVTGEVKVNTKQPRVAAPRMFNRIQNRWTSSWQIVG
jgi:CHAD domain-containing protein